MSLLKSILSPKSESDTNTPKEKKGKKEVHTKSIFDNDKVIKLLAVIIAVVSWFVVSTFIDPDTPRDIKNIPLDLNIAGTAAQVNQLEVVDVESQTVNVRVEGKSYKVGLLSPADFIVTLDMSSVTEPGTYSLEVIAKKVDAQDTDYDIIYTDPTYVKVTFDRLMTKNFELTSNFENITTEDGLFMEQVVLTPTEVAVTGPSSVVSKIAYCVVENDEKIVIKTSTVLDGELKFYDENKNEIDSTLLSCSEDKFKVTIPVYKKQDIPLVFDYINVPEGIDESKLEYKISKSTIKVGIPVDVSTNVENIVLGTIDFRDIDIGSVFSFDVTLLAGYINIDGITSVTVSFKEEDMTSVRLSSENIVIKNKPANYDVNLITERLYDIKLVGETKVIEGLSANDIVVTVDLGDVAVSVGEKVVPVEVSLATDELAWAVGDEYSLLIKISDKKDAEA